jgi:hypothetical protein
MINYTWKALELFANDQILTNVKYCLTGEDGQNSVTTEGNHFFNEGIVTKPLNQIVESDIVQWLEKDTTQDEVNPIKLAVENQLKALENIKKVDFPWLTGTFTIE